MFLRLKEKKIRVIRLELFPFKINLSSLFVSKFITNSNHGFHRTAGTMSDTSSKIFHHGRILFDIRRLEKLRKRDMKQTKATTKTTTK